MIAKLAHGIADDLLTSTLLETTCPLVVAPAMHTGMWQHPATPANADTLAERGAASSGPVVGALAAGDEGLGRMAEPEDIFRAIEGAVARRRDLDGMRIVVTAGPTHEPIDPVRFIGNRSTGKMGVRGRRGGVGTRGRRPPDPRARTPSRAAGGCRRRARRDRRGDAPRRRVGGRRRGRRW